jgi:hypothetical protein
MNDRRGLTLGIVLVLAGFFLLLENVVSWRGPGPILVLIGAALLISSALRRFRGPLLPGAILLGLGAAFLLQVRLETWFPHWATILLGLAAGFLLVAALDASVGRRRRPAPGVVGFLLLAVAAAAGISRVVGPEAFEPLARLWPWLLVASGIALIVTSALRRKMAP